MGVEIKLRDYQEKIISDVRAEWMAGRRSVLIVMPTGAGKTRVGSEIVHRSVTNGRQVLWLAHRLELVSQASAAFYHARIPHGLIVAGEEHENCNVHIGSIPTVVRRLERIPRPDIIVVDESHHAPSKTWKKILDTFKTAYCVGLTATPMRLSGEGLGECFEALVEGPNVAELIRQGYLCPYRYFGRKMDMRGVKVRAGEYARGEVVSRLEKSKITGSLIEEYLERAGNKRMLVFCPTIKFSEKMAAEFINAGILAAHVDGNTPENERTLYLENFREGRIKVICSVELFTEGLDVPAVEVIGMVRPTQSLGMYRQMVGRGMRVAEGKEELIILDSAGNFERHGLPDDPIEWSLEGTKKNDRPRERPVSSCKFCFAVFYSGPKKCPVCGQARIVKERKIREEKGRLEEIKREERAMKAQEKKWKSDNRKKIQSYEDAVEFGKRNGYKTGWAKYYCQARNIPILPSDERPNE